MAGRPDLDRLPAPLRSTVEVGRAMAREWRSDRVTDLAAEVAFFSILSLFPGLLALTALLGLIDPIFGADVAADVERDIVDALVNTLDLQEGSDTLRAFENLFDSRSPGLLTFGLVAAVWAMSRGFASLIRALHVAYDLQERRRWLRLRLTALALAVGSLVIGALLLTVMVLGPLLGAGEDVAEAVGLGSAFATFWDLFRAPVAFLVVVLWMATLFHVAPNHHTPWRADVIGAVVSALLALLVSLGFRVYISVAGGGNEVFGVLGSAISLLIWLYLLSLSVLIGGELNAVLWARKGMDKLEGRGPQK
jgi:membrane protein